MDQLNRFLGDTVGNKFAIRNIFRRETITRLSHDYLDESKPVVKKGREFFCSELVAKCYKVCGIMENNKKSSSSYWPHNFATKEFTLPLLEEVEIKPEKNLIPPKL